MSRGDRGNWGGARHPQRPNAKPRGRKPAGLRVDLGIDLTTELRALAAAAGIDPAALAARWLVERLVAEWATYERERGVVSAEPAPAEWSGEAL